MDNLFLLLNIMHYAEKEGFEPPEVLPSTVFKTAAFDRSAISPIAQLLLSFQLCGCKGTTIFIICKFFSNYFSNIFYKIL